MSALYTSYLENQRNKATTHEKRLLFTLISQPIKNRKANSSKRTDHENINALLQYLENTWENSQVLVPILTVFLINSSSLQIQVFFT